MRPLKWVIELDDFEFILIFYYHPKSSTSSRSGGLQCGNEVSGELVEIGFGVGKG